MRKALIRKLQQLSIAYHVETQSGRLQSKIMRDAEAVETLVHTDVFKHFKYCIKYWCGAGCDRIQKRDCVRILSTDGAGGGDYHGVVPRGDAQAQ